MFEFEIVCPLSREPRLKEIEAKAAGCKWVLKKRSIDARKEPVWRYRYEAYTAEDQYIPYSLPEYQDVRDAREVLIVGAGPAGMFAALKLISLGLKPIIIERGKDVHSRKADMALLSREGKVDPDSNYCYGEGGAGAFSDGKLYTRSSKRGDIREVLHALVKFGASKDILVDAHPHIGSDKLPVVVENIRKFIIEKGGEYHFGQRVVAIDKLEDGTFELTALSSDDAAALASKMANGAASARKVTDSFSASALTARLEGAKKYRAKQVILATGHSARDIYEMLYNAGGQLEAKGFALGVRVEHPQEKINWSQYHGQWKPGIPAAEYSFVEQIDGRGVFSFCMCPGGILVPSSTEAQTVVLNGMSNSARSGKFANAGVVVQIEPEDVPGDSPFRLMDFQRDVERKMYSYAQSAGAEHPMTAPAQRMEDFCVGRISKAMPPTSYFPGVVSAPLHTLLPNIVADRLRKAFPRIKMRNYYTNAALLLGVESRTSSPVRIPRDPQSYEYLSVSGLYPCGEGAGYAGGIVSSALDGINVAEALAKVELG